MENNPHQELAESTPSDSHRHIASRLLLLPRELRDMIYVYIIPSGCVKLTHYPNGHLRKTFGSGLLHLCSQIRAESLAIYAKVPIKLQWHQIGVYIAAFYPSEEPTTMLKYTGDIELNMMCNFTSPIDILPLLRLQLCSPRVKVDFYDIRYGFYGMITSTLDLAFSCVKNSPFKPWNMGIPDATLYVSEDKAKRTYDGRWTFWFNHVISNVFLTLERPFPRVRIHIKKNPLKPIISSDALSEELHAWIDYIGIEEMVWRGRLTIIIEGEDNIQELELAIMRA